MNLKYTETGLWLETIEDTTRVGLSVKGQDDVGEVMFVELPKFDKKINKGENLLSVEGAKAVTEILVPFSGKVKKVHKELEENPALLNSIRQEDNWLVEFTDIQDLDKNSLSEEPWFGHKPEGK